MLRRASSLQLDLAELELGHDHHGSSYAELGKGEACSLLSMAGFWPRGS